MVTVHSQEEKRARLERKEFLTLMDPKERVATFHMGEQLAGCLID